LNEGGILHHSKLAADGRDWSFSTDPASLACRLMSASVLKATELLRTGEMT
jgi:hypothetical protein